MSSQSDRSTHATRRSRPPARGDSSVPGPETARADTSRQSDLLSRFHDVRQTTRRLASLLGEEDASAQSMLDASPAKWHLAHTSWFFEAFVLADARPGYEPFDPRYNYLFNSYYNAKGDRQPRDKRGLITRPTLDEVMRFREAVDQRVAAWLATGSIDPHWLDLIEIGLHHEQQHQELLLTDVKHLLWCNPLRPAYCRDPLAPPPYPVETRPRAGRTTIEPGVYAVGHDPADGFAYDHEGPRHRVFLEPCQLADRLVTNDEYLAFIEDGGYQRHELWLDLGWSAVQAEQWSAPLYWEKSGEQWTQFTLNGPVPLHGEEPVCFVSYFEADAYARWAGARLPTEFEWEVACRQRPDADRVDGVVLDDRRLHPAAPRQLGSGDPAAAASGPRQMIGDAWEWTSSHFSAYPGYKPPAGAVSEYNGKFMCNQFVLRGGSCLTPRSHLRPSYRNFFHPASRWQAAAIRLAWSDA